VHLPSGKTNLTDIDTKLYLSRPSHQGGQEAVPRASAGWGAVSKPGLGKSQSPISAWCSGFTLVRACISSQQRESRSVALGESQDIEADS